MSQLHIVTILKPGFAREDEGSPSAVGAYTNPVVAEAVRRVSGIDAQVLAVDIDVIPAGLRASMEALGIQLPDGY